MKKTFLTRFIAPCIALSLASGCSSYSSLSGAAPSGDFGATPGGVKDLSSARALVDNGQVPPASALLVEAAFAEHDLPLNGAPCSRALCLRSAVGIAPDEEGRQAGWLQIGMSSSIDPATYKRNTLHAILTVDVSGSMGWSSAHSDNPDYATPGRLAYLLSRKIASQLTPGDSVSLVTYGSNVTTVLESVAGDDPQIYASIERLTTAGSTNMEAGLRRAYEIASRRKGVATDSRVFLFSDEQPNVGATAATDRSMREAGPRPRRPGRPRPKHRRAPPGGAGRTGSGDCPGRWRRPPPSGRGGAGRRPRPGTGSTG